MKRLLIALSLAASLFASAATNVATNTPLPDPVAAIKAAAPSNLNEVVISMLSGVKDAGGEIYTASKTAISKSVDFAVQQAPDVVHQFIVWHLIEQLTYYVLWMIPVALLLYGSKLIKRHYTDSVAGGTKWRDDDKGLNVFLRFVAVVAAVIVLMASTANVGIKAAQIGFAPKVFILDYVIKEAKELKN